MASLLSLSGEVFPYIIGLNSSQDVRQVLAKAFGSVSQNRQLQIHIELQQLKKNDLSISVYLQCAKTLKDELHAAGRSLSTVEFNAIIYKYWLEYHNIITALDLRPDPVPSHELHEQLVAHEILLKSCHKPPHANMMTRQFNNNSLPPLLHCQIRTPIGKETPIPNPKSLVKYVDHEIIPQINVATFTKNKIKIPIKTKSLKNKWPIIHIIAHHHLHPIHRHLHLITLCSITIHPQRHQQIIPTHLLQKLIGILILLLIIISPQTFNH